MAKSVINKTTGKGELIHETFLSSLVTKVHSPLSKGMDDKMMHKIASVNGHVEELNNVIASNTPLISEINCTCIDLSATAYETNNGLYVPVKLGLNVLPPTKRSAFGPSWLMTSTFVYLNRIGRPNSRLVLDKMKHFFKNEYQGSIHIQDGRYVFCLDGLSEKVLAHWFDLAKKGDGKIIDYSWIAPLQDLYDEKMELNLKASQLKKKNLKRAVDVEDHWETLKTTISTRALPRSTEGLLKYITYGDAPKPVVKAVKESFLMPKRRPKWSTANEITPLVKKYTSLGHAISQISQLVKDDLYIIKTKEGTVNDYNWVD